LTKSREYRQEDRDEFMALLGTCITEWAWIEEEVYQVCHRVLGTVSEHTSIIYYRTPTLEARLNLANELMATIFPKPENGKHPDSDSLVWSKLLGEIKDAMPVRNQLAHSPTGAAIFGFMDDETGEVSEGVEIKMQSYPRSQELARPGKPAKKELRSEDLATYLPMVRHLHTRLRTFRLDILPNHVKRVFPQHCSI